LQLVFGLAVVSLIAAALVYYGKVFTSSLIGSEAD
jgi:hypothetical protein